jgi:F-type H+-transporting ATPase subunit b
LSASWVTFLFEAGNFLLLAAVLGRLFFRPVREALERRRSELESEQSAAAEARADAERARQDTREKLAELEDSLEALRERARLDAEAERDRLIEAARDQMQRERDTLKGELVSHRRAQARSLARDAAFAAREIVVRLLERMDGPDLERSLMWAACEELEKLASAGPLAPVNIESARPLEHESLTILAHAAGVSPTSLDHHVDADLVAGIRVLTARGVVDASAAGLAAQAERLLVDRLEHGSSNHG